MVHPAHRGITQNFDSPYLFECIWTKNVIDAAIVNCRITGCASQITKVAQDMTVRFAIVFQVVSIKICLVGCFEFEVEIAGDENVRRLRSSPGPIDQSFGVSPSPSGVERISVSAQQ